MAKDSNNKVQQGHIKRKGVIDVAPNGEEISFKAYNEGEPAHRNVRSCQGGGKRYETIGKKEPKLMLNLQCPVDAADPFSLLADQFDRLTKDLKPNAQRKLPERQRVVNEGGLQCWMNQSQQRLIYTGEIDLAVSHNWQSELLRQAQLLVRRLPASDAFIKAIKSIKKEEVNGQ